MKKFKLLLLDANIVISNSANPFGASGQAKDSKKALAASDIETDFPEANDATSFAKLISLQDLGVKLIK